MGSGQYKSLDNMVQYTAIQGIVTVPLDSMDDFFRLVECKNPDCDKLKQILELVKIHPEWVNTEKLLDWYEKETTKWMTKEPHGLLLAELIPTHTRNWTKILAQIHDIAIMKIIAPKLKLDHVNENGETFLMLIGRSQDWDRTVVYFSELIETIDNLPLEHIDKCKTFVDTMLLNVHFWKYVKQQDYTRLFNALAKRGYEFKDHDQGKSLLSRLVTQCDYTQHYASLIAIETWDPAWDPEWLIYLFRHYDNRTQHNYFHNLFRRTDYKSFLRRAYINDVVTFGLEFCDIVRKAASLSKNKTIEMLCDPDAEGNTIFHLIAQRHDKTILYPLLAIAKQWNITMQANTEGKTPTQLYHESKVRL